MYTYMYTYEYAQLCFSRESGARAGGLRLARLDVATHELVQARISIYLSIYLSMYLYMHIYIALFLAREWRTSGGTEVGAA